MNDSAVASNVSVKKRKTDSSVSPSSTSASKIFSPYRSIGNITNNVPFAIGTLGKTYYIVTSVGNFFQVYDALTLNLLFVSKTFLPSKITNIYCHYHYIFVTYQNKINIYKRGSLIISLDSKLDSNYPINNLLTFGDYLIVSNSNNQISLFKKPVSIDQNDEIIKNNTNFQDLLKLPIKFYNTINLSNANSDDLIVKIIHPSTYLNKLIIATTSHILIYNIKTINLIFKSNLNSIFSRTEQDTSQRNKNYLGAISTVENSTVLDIILIATNLGNLIFYDFRKDKVLKIIKTYSRKSGPSNLTPITSLAFRSDSFPHLLIAFKNGNLSVFDLNSFQQIYLLQSVHKQSFGGISNVKFLNGQPIFITNGADNQLKEYIFDPSFSSNNEKAINDSSLVPLPRLLRSRAGHSAPPTSILFTAHQSHFILSASTDNSFWSFSLRKDSQNQKLSFKQSKKNKKIMNINNSNNSNDHNNEIISMDYQILKEDDWDNILTAHKNQNFANTWSFKNKKIGNFKLQSSDNSNINTVKISSCGNFAFLGTANGNIDVYNLQSGILRKKFKLHKNSVTGIIIDSMNNKMCSTSLDGYIGFYNFRNSKYLSKINLESPITKIVYNPISELLGLALDDLSIIIIDFETKRIIRQLFGHTNRITSLDFSPDGRWIVSSSLDSTLRVWDLPTGNCIDGFKISNIITNLKFSPNGDFLATSHVNGNGISLWNNKSQFKMISVRHVSEKDFKLIDVPNNTSAGGLGIIDSAFDNDNQDNDDSLNSYSTVDQISKDLLTLSIGPRSKFNTLLNLDTIKQRNKPKEPPKKSEKAPFFLYETEDKSQNITSNGKSEKIEKLVSTENQNSDNNNNNSEKIPSLTNPERPLKFFNNENTLAFESKFTKTLRECSVLDDYTIFLDLISTSSPSSLDLEIKSLNTKDSSLSEIKLFVKAMIHGLNSNKNFELYQALINLLLKNHGDLISSSLNDEQELESLLDELNRINNEKTNRIDELIRVSASIVNFFQT
ncbi:rRNA-processing protein UTP21 [Ascoidea rubescens DSM 1968]|uniref:Utp21-domain-containing protein n=1 Tax=Ascoidea rubescens DSM 1968 TaxID=1344418 RepID=A0A1D2VPC6_9ASCO|nr:Utp21-domain-containing protein [Ascoidea rubescens DSM 1968]ODV63472.1 Utp21-domain-containing protein [Ascoidea rubescens DSM 1968]